MMILVRQLLLNAVLAYVIRKTIDVGIAGINKRDELLIDTKKHADTIEIAKRVCCGAAAISLLYSLAKK